ncbi:MAG: hypothetical protein GY856_36325 [bacterium]|nr:hypothetical protein [bacterium]
MSRQNEIAVAPQAADPPAAGRWRYLGFLVLALGILALLLVAGYGPTLRLGGEKAVLSMLVACGITLIGSLAGAVPVFLARRLALPEAMPAVMGSIALRLALVLAGGLAVALAGVVARVPLLVWLVISHTGLLVADTLFTRSVLGLGRRPGRDTVKRRKSSEDR